MDDGKDKLYDRGEIIRIVKRKNKEWIMENMEYYQDIGELNEGINEEISIFGSMRSMRSMRTVSNKLRDGGEIGDNSSGESRIYEK